MSVFTERLKEAMKNKNLSQQATIIGMVAAVSAGPIIFGQIASRILQDEINQRYEWDNIGDEPYKVDSKRFNYYLDQEIAKEKQHAKLCNRIYCEDVYSLRSINEAYDDYKLMEEWN